MDLAVGIDLGGTAIKAGLVASDGRIVHRTSIPTNAEEGVDAVVGRLIALAQSMTDHPLARSDKVLGIGVGSPGTIRRADGVVVFSPNLGWHQVPLAARLSAKLGRGVVLNNDANLAALAEYVCGAGRGTVNMVMLTLGTGVGGGIISNGRLYAGTRGNAGELGHMMIQPDGRPCGCGQRGCLEMYASASATAARAAEAIHAGRASALSLKLDSEEGITSADVAHAMAAGDALASEIWAETCRYLAIACINLQMAFDPDCIILAGGMSAAGEALLNPLNEQIQANMSPTLAPSPEIRIAELQNDAGFVGAGLSVFEP